MRSTNLHKVALIFKEYMCSIHAKASPADSCSHASHGDNAVQRLCTLDDDDAANVPHIVDNNMAPHPCTLDDVATLSRLIHFHPLNVFMSLSFLI